MKPVLPCLILITLLACSNAPLGFGQSATARTIAALLAAPEPGRAAQLDGRIVGKKNIATWIFQDATGTLLVNMDEDVEKGVTRELKKGAAMRVEGTLFRPFGSQKWVLRAADIQALKGGLPKFATPVRPSAHVQSRVVQTPTAQTAVVTDRSGRKPYILPRLFGRSGKSTGQAVPAIPPVAAGAAQTPTSGTAVPTTARAAATTIAEVLRSPNAGPVALSGTVMDVMSTQKILLWDGTAAMAVRLDRLVRVPELTRTQRVSVRGTLVREGTARIELQATEVR